MKMRWLLPLCVAILAGVGFLVVLDQVLNEARRREKQEPMVPAVVAADTLEPSQEIAEGMVQIKRVYASMLPEEHFVDVEELIGRVVRTHVPAGYPVTKACLLPEGTLAGFDAKIPPGYRALAIKVDAWSSVAGFVVPGSHVDVIAEVPDRSSRRKSSKTILQNVEVAAVGSSTSREDLASDRKDPRSKAKDRRSVTLFLTPREVEILHEANAGRLTLALRSGADDSRYTSVNEPPVVVPIPVAPKPVQETPKPTPPPAPIRKPEPKEPERFVQWEIHGQKVEEVTYVRINGVWQRENSANAYGGGTPISKVPLPKLQTADATKPGQAAGQQSRQNASEESGSK